MKSFKKTKESKGIYEILKEGKYSTSKFRKCVQKAYISNNFRVYNFGKEIKFSEGYGRSILIPKDIVEDVIGTEIIYDN